MIVLNRDDEDPLKETCEVEANGREIRIEKGRKVDQSMVVKERRIVRGPRTLHASKEGGSTSATCRSER